MLVGIEAWGQLMMNLHLHVVAVSIYFMLAWPIEVHFLSSVLKLLATDLHLDVA